MVLSLLLYSGHRVVGPVLDRLPGGSDLLLHRYIIGVHFAGMLLAGIGAVWAFRAVVSGARFVLRIPGRTLIAASIACVLAVVVMWPVLVDRDHYANNDTVLHQRRRSPPTDRRRRESTALIDIAKQRGGGRVYAGLPNNWGGRHQGRPGRRALHAAAAGRRLTRLHAAHRLAEPGHRVVLQRARTRRSTTSSTSSTCCDPPGRQPSVPATKIADDGGYTLWRGARTSADTSRWSTRPSRCTRTAPTWPRSSPNRSAGISRRPPSRSSAIRSWRSTGSTTPTPSSSAHGAVHRASGSGRLEQRRSRQRSLRRARCTATRAVVGDAEGVVRAALAGDGRRQAGQDRDARAELRRRAGPAGHAPRRVPVPLRHEVPRIRSRSVLLDAAGTRVRALDVASLPAAAPRSAYEAEPVATARLRKSR